MKDVREIYKKALKMEDLSPEDFRKVLELSFTDKVRLIRELVKDNGINSFQFFKIEYLVKYGEQDYDKTLDLIKYTIKLLAISEKRKYRPLIRELLLLGEEVLDSKRNQEIPQR